MRFFFCWCLTLVIVSCLFLAAMWSLAGKWLASWLSYIFLCFLYFPIWCSGSCMVLDCIEFWSLHSSLFWNFKEIVWKKEGKGQESIQSNTTPDPGHHMGKWQKHNKTTPTYKRAKRPFLSQQVTTRLQGTDNSYTCTFLRKITNLKTSSAAI